MNLQHRLQNRTTATVRFISETQAIYSDEVTSDHTQCLRILEADDKTALWNQVMEIAKVEASQTRFNPVINVITPEGDLKVRKLTPIKAQPNESCPY